MSASGVALVLIGLLVLLAAEIGAAWLHANILVAPLIGLAMAGIVAATFMRLSVTTGLPRVFALAAAFWLMVLLGMGSLDALTRHDIYTHPDRGLPTQN
jgi:caa(3)-type oxidase subunit IV